jgi:Fur family transcriptional regulator, ferric uptake regulator
LAKEKEIKSLLKKHHLSVTEPRVKILELFLGSGDALSHSEIEKAQGQTLDRVTVYRTLQSFVEKGILHTIPAPDNSVKYAVCKDTCDEGHHQDNHVHFICENCGKTLCLDHVTIPPVQLPAGYVSAQTQMIVNGICDLCQQKPTIKGRRHPAATT